jgi:hypothetical protein
VAEPRKTEPRSRGRDVESIARELFVAMLPASRGVRTPERVAEEAFDAARAFCRAADSQEHTPPG